MTEVNEVNFSKGGKMAEGEGGKGLGRIIRLAIITVVVILVLGVGGYFGWSFWQSRSAEEKTAKGGAKGGGKSSEEFLEKPQYLDLGSFVVNLADGRRFLKATIQLLLSEEGAKAYLNTRLVEVKDLVLAELQSLTAESLRDPRTREDVKQRILLRIESILPPSSKDWKDPRPIKKLLITEFYIQ